MLYDQIVQEMQRMQEYSSILSFSLPEVKALGGRENWILCFSQKFILFILAIS